MKQIKNSEYEEYQKYLRDKNNGRILTPDGLRLICQANNYDAEKKTMLKEKDTYVKQRKQNSCF